MRLSRRLIPVALLGVLAIAFVVARPALAARHPDLTILEFPAGAAILAILLWMAFRRPAPPPAPAWRRHEQVVRALPDPALLTDVAALQRWLDRGEAPEAAAQVLARATNADASQHAAQSARLADAMTLTTSRKKRGSFLKQHLEGV